MSYIIFLFFKYYNQGATKQIPYQKAVFSFVTLVFINLISIASFFISFKEIHFSSRIQSYAFFGVILAIIYFVINRIIPEQTIRDYDATNKNTKLHGWLLFFYVFISFIFLLITIIRLRHK
ncbi:hypothetical protein D3C86_1544200 [compost metagenome]